ncbi:hypothetical protein JCM3766R1_000447 [Sporobolomyces carnicolor]
MNCIVCSEWLNGDQSFIETHLNHCLDRQGSSSSATASLSGAFARDEALALSLARQEQEQLFDEDRDSSCPCCQVLWSDIFPSDPKRAVDVDEKRNRHVLKCFEARARNSVPADGDPDDEEELPHGTYERDEQGDDPSDHDGEQEYRICSRNSHRTAAWTGGLRTKHQVKGTRGLLPVIRDALSSSNRSSHGKTLVAYLANDQVEHIGTKFGDWGWGCGYKNLQMILSSAIHLPQYAALSRQLASLDGTDGSRTDEVPIPTIPELQAIIESAWSQGFDPPGARHFHHKLVGSKRWIGTTEVFTALSFLGYRSRIVDFPKVKKGEIDADGSSDGTHQTLIKWIVSYFSTNPSSDKRDDAANEPDKPHDAYAALFAAASHDNHRRRGEDGGARVAMTVSRSKQPLYLQHQGHSRTIVGIERMKSSAPRSLKEGSGSGGDRVGEGDEWLLIFDPGKPISNELKNLATAPTLESGQPLAKKPKLNGFGRASHAAAASTTPSLSSSSSSLKGTANRPEGNVELKFGDVLKVFRVNMKALKRKDEYQILYVEESGKPLTPREKDRRKTVKSEMGKSRWVPLQD